MKIKVLLKEGTWDDSFKTPQYQSITLDAEQLARPKVQELIAKKYGMTVVGDVSFGTAYSNVFRVEPDNIENYATKTLIMKLSSNDKEYIAYEKIKNIRERMLQSEDQGDKAAAKYLPIVYVAEQLQTNSDNPEYKSIIIMEPLKEFTGNLRNLPKSLTGKPTSTPSLLVTMLKDEEFLHRVLNSVLKEEFKSQLSQIENQIFTGKAPNTNQKDQDYINSLIQTKIVDPSKKSLKFPERPIELTLMQLKKPLTAVQKNRAENWQNQYDEDSENFFNNIKRLRFELSRIGFILIDNLGEKEGREAFENLLSTIEKSTPVAAVTAIHNPHPQNQVTKPEEVTPAAANFNDALQRLEQYGLTRKDLHGKNYMMRENGQIVISDPGLFQIIDAIKESKNANFKIKIKRNS